MFIHIQHNYNWITSFCVTSDGMNMINHSKLNWKIQFVYNRAAETIIYHFPQYFCFLFVEWLKLYFITDQSMCYKIYSFFVCYSYDYEVYFSVFRWTFYSESIVSNKLKHIREKIQKHNKFVNLFIIDLTNSI